MTNGPGREPQTVADAAVTALPAVYLVTGSLAVTALAAAVLVAVGTSHRFGRKSSRAIARRAPGPHL